MSYRALEAGIAVQVVLNQASMVRSDCALGTLDALQSVPTQFLKRYVTLIRHFKKEMSEIH